MYESGPDPYCYPGTTVLRNISGIRDQAALERFETIASHQRAEETLPSGRLSVRHYRAIHHHLFQDVYLWAGRYRTVRLSKGGNMFCYPEHIPVQMKRLFDGLRAVHCLRNLSADEFSIEAAHFLAALNAIHPFREGNGRTQLAFLGLLANEASHSLALQRLRPKPFLHAMIKSFAGDERSLAREIRTLIKH